MFIKGGNEDRKKVKPSEHRILGQIRKGKKSGGGKPESFLFLLWHKYQAMMLTVIGISHCGAEIIVCWLTMLALIGGIK